MHGYVICIEYVGNIGIPTGLFCYVWIFNCMYGYIRIFMGIKGFVKVCMGTFSHICLIMGTWVCILPNVTVVHFTLL